MKNFSEKIGYMSVDSHFRRGNYENIRFVCERVIWNRCEANLCLGSCTYFEGFLGIIEAVSYDGPNFLENSIKMWNFQENEFSILGNQRRESKFLLILRHYTQKISFQKPTKRSKFSWIIQRTVKNLMKITWHMTFTFSLS